MLMNVKWVGGEISLKPLYLYKVSTDRWNLVVHCGSNIDEFKVNEIVGEKKKIWFILLDVNEMWIFTIL